MTRLVEVMGPGMALVECDGEVALWSRSKLRKPRECAVTGEALPVGTTVWRVVGNQSYRMLRVSSEGLRSLPREVDGDPV